MARQTQSISSLLVLSLLLVGVLGGANLATAIEVGEAAPDFTLVSTTGKKISLKQFRDKHLVLLEFYSNDFVPT